MTLSLQPSLDLGAPLGLRGQRVLITGGSRGIGAATARLLASLGARVAFTFVQDAGAAERLAAELRDGGAEVLALRADQRSREDARTTVAAVEEAWGGLDAFVGNAGIWLPTPSELDGEAELQAVIETNLTGLFRWHAEVVPALRRAGGGRLVLLSSTAGQRGEAGYGAYAATKGAVISLVKSLAPELGPSGIRVNAVAPGWVDTDLSASALRGDAAERRRIEGIFPLGRIPDAEDLAGPIAFLLSDWARAVTGEVLNVNGGTVLCG
ncbi:MAG TPA: SDR family oxidoreductase [Holophagaceae bacterium]|nr:SDR family oxidoreductase [Holophagaceae bacterium]